MIRIYNPSYLLLEFLSIVHLNLSASHKKPLKTWNRAWVSFGAVALETDFTEEPPWEDTTG
jgi:hypothetical protein